MPTHYETLGVPKGASADEIRVPAETVAAATLALSAIYILFNETLANWQAVWFALALIVLAVTLVPARGARDSK